MNSSPVIRRLLLVLTIVFMSVGTCYSADGGSAADSMKTSYLFSLHPLQLIANSWRVELERKPEQSPLSLSISPEFYFGVFENASNNIMLFANHDSIEILGYGLTLSGRYYVSDGLNRAPAGSQQTLTDQRPYSNFYIFSAVEYRHVDLTFFTRGWIKYRENGIDIYKMGDVEQATTIQRVGANLGLGNTIFFGDRFFMDFFLYMRITKAFQSSALADSKVYKDSYFTLSGNSFALGFRFGLLF